MTAPTLTWITLPDTGAEVLFDDQHPLMLHLTSGQDLAKVRLELEARHGWRVVTETLRGIDDPRGWLLAVEWCGRLAQACTYEEIRQADIESGPWTKDQLCDVGFCGLVGLQAYFMVGQLRKPWKDHAAGTWVVWASHPHVVGVFYRVGLRRMASALADLEPAWLQTEKTEKRVAQLIEQAAADYFRASFDGDNQEAADVAAEWTMYIQRSDLFRELRPLAEFLGHLTERHRSELPEGEE